MDEKKRTWLYCRIDAPEDEHDRLKEQRKKLMDYAEQLEFEVVGVSQDTGSGLNFGRNGLAEISEAARTGNINALLIFNLSRLGRDAVLTMELIHGLNEQGVKVYSVMEGEIKMGFHDVLTTQVVDALMSLKDLKAMECPYLVGYVQSEDSSEPQLLRVTPTNIAAFIAKNATLEGNDVKITTPLDMPFLSTCGGFIDYCSDQEFLRSELLPVLIPMQLGDTEPSEVELFQEDELDSSEESVPELMEANDQGIKFNF